MAYEQRDQSGALFKNDKGQDNHPDYRGNCKISGKEWAISAWIKTTKNGGKFMSLSFSEPQRKDAKPATKPPTADLPSGKDEGSDSLPF